MFNTKRIDKTMTILLGVAVLNTIGMVIIQLLK